MKTKRIPPIKHEDPVMNQEMKALVAQARKQGIAVAHTRNGHVRFRTADGSIVTAPSTPSDHRSIRNTLAALRKHGFTVRTNTTAKKEHRTMPSTTKTYEPTAAVQRLLDRHSSLLEKWREAFADVETSEEPQDSAAMKKLVAKRDRCGKSLQDVAAKLEAEGFTLRHFDSVPVPPKAKRTSKPASSKPASKPQTAAAKKASAAKPASASKKASTKKPASTRTSSSKVTPPSTLPEAFTLAQVKPGQIYRLKTPSRKSYLCGLVKKVDLKNEELTVDVKWMGDKKLTFAPGDLDVLEVRMPTESRFHSVQL